VNHASHALRLRAGTFLTVARLLAGLQAVVALTVSLAAGCASAAQEVSPREQIPFNADWRFTKGDPADVGDKLSYTNIKPWVITTGGEFSSHVAPIPPSGQLGADVAYTQSEFDDTGWRRLNLPHDWGIEGPFKQEYPGETGKLPWWGVGWYRKHFNIPASDLGRQLYLDVDGAMSYGVVWLNGQFVGGWPYGCASWRVDLTPHIKFGAENVLAFRLDNPPDSSRWYPGGGIYRNVWLVKTSPVHVSQWGSYVTTPVVRKESATVAVRVTVENCSRSVSDVTVRSEIYSLDAKGGKGHRPVASTRRLSMEISAGLDGLFAAAGIVRDPRLWSLHEPNLYVAVTTVEQSGKVVDRYETRFGIRTIKFDAEHGFFLNGELTEIKGVCLHHDLGALGAAFNSRAQERQLELVREMGCNAIRTSHNPPAPELLDLCDRMGFVVMVEAFDAWRMAKRTNDYSVLFDDWHEKDLRALVRRDRNHPSVILWSLGNEVYEQREGTNAPLAARLAEIAHQEDATRPVNMALHVVAASTNGFQNVVDVFGYNYTPFGYAAFRTDNPHQPLVGSETASCVSSRGEYFFPVSTNRREGRFDFQATSYDYAAPAWAMAPDIEFKGQDENPFVAGEFVWTGLDYLGEPTPYDRDTTNMPRFTDPILRAKAEQELKETGKISVPSRSSYFGILDLCGFRKDRFYIYQARWRPDLPMAHILPHWNWPERADQTMLVHVYTTTAISALKIITNRVAQVTPVHVYTSGDEAELFLNGKSLGRKKKEQFQYRLCWDDVIYQPGELKVVAYKNGKPWATDVRKTAGPAAKIKMAADRNRIRADGTDLSFITVTVTDKHGRLVPRS